MEAIILAGGFGTRLQEVVKDVPKPMAQINQKPFLEYMFEYLKRQGVTKVILCVGYKKEHIKEYFQHHFKGIEVEYSVEEEPLGTGGAIQKALKEKTFQNTQVVVLNGDSFFDVDLSLLFKKGLEEKFDIILSLKQIENSDRYGAVQIDQTKVLAFEEKKFFKKAFVNGGVYLLNTSIFNDLKVISKFSFEEYLEKSALNGRLGYFLENDKYFIDIGVPVDYARAQNDFAKIF